MAERGKKSGPDLSKTKGVSKEELDEEMENFKKGIDEEPFSPHEMGRNYPVQGEEAKE